LCTEAKHDRRSELAVVDELRRRMLPALCKRNDAQVEDQEAKNRGHSSCEGAKQRRATDMAEGRRVIQQLHIVLRCGVELRHTRRRTQSDIRIPNVTYRVGF